jgi:hypothetical protein
MSSSLARFKGRDSSGTKARIMVKSKVGFRARNRVRIIVRVKLWVMAGGKIKVMVMAMIKG